MHGAVEHAGGAGAWGAGGVEAFLAELGLDKYAGALAAGGVADRAALEALDDGALQRLGVTAIGARRKLLAATQCPPPRPAPPARFHPRPAGLSLAQPQLPLQAPRPT